MSGGPAAEPGMSAEGRVDGALGGRGGGVLAAPSLRDAPPPLAVKTYRPRLPATWWLRNRRYLFFMVRDFTVVPITLWLVSLLVQLWRLREGEGAVAFASPAYVAFSLVCLAFALLHSVTWLNLSGVILRVKLGQKVVPPGMVTGVNFAQWVLATLVIGALLIWLGR